MDNSMYTPEYEKKQQMYEEVVQKQNGYIRKTLGLVFGILGGAFLLVGLILWLCNVTDEDGFAPSLVFAPMGAFWLLLGIVLYVAIGRTSSSDTYEKYLARCEKSGFTNSTDMYVTLALLQRRVDELENQVRLLEQDKR